MDWIHTSVGLPNTCSRCGTPCDAEMGWYAPNLDAARAGGGVDEKCYAELSAQAAQSWRETPDPVAKPSGTAAPDHDAPAQRKRSKG